MPGDINMGCRRMTGKVALIAGAATGFVRASALRLAQEGAAVVVGSPAGKKAHIDTLVEEVSATSGQALGCVFNATDEASRRWSRCWRRRTANASAASASLSMADRR